MIYQSLNVKKL
uniref:Uncharacterized protein n=1 Tax=Anguilla anguilla TaxID=7936 RepID=A0A0E9R4V8_ANGAN